MLFFIPGTVTYSLVTLANEDPKFEINDKTGLIRTTRIFDRDLPAGEKEGYVTVSASDNGQPDLGDLCTFKITIKDINDNAPLFEKVVSSFKRS